MDKQEHWLKINLNKTAISRDCLHQFILCKFWNFIVTSCRDSCSHFYNRLNMFTYLVYCTVQRCCPFKDVASAISGFLTELSVEAKINVRGPRTQIVWKCHFTRSLLQCKAEENVLSELTGGSQHARLLDSQSNHFVALIYDDNFLDGGTMCKREAEEPYC